MASMTIPAPCPNSIFILGISQRSGTNFLYNLVCLHPDCVGSVPWEDFLVHYSDLLGKYVDSVSSHWLPAWDVRGDSLYQYLGSGLLSFLTAQAGGKRLVTKTPSVHNLSYFFKLFPQAYLLILVRDGRAVVESGVKSFGWDYETAMRAWAEAARVILDFDQANKNSSLRYLIVRYEDICNNCEGELRRVLAFLDLSVKTYDFEAAVHLPIRGSSELKAQGEKTTHWHPVEKTSAFTPLQRWSHWSRSLHERFNWIAGQYLVQFGYEEKRYPANRLLWTVWNRILDSRPKARSVVRNLKRSFKVV